MSYQFSWKLSRPTIRSTLKFYPPDTERATLRVVVLPRPPPSSPFFIQPTSREKFYAENALIVEFMLPSVIKHLWRASVVESQCFHRILIEEGTRGEYVISRARWQKPGEEEEVFLGWKERKKKKKGEEREKKNFNFYGPIWQRGPPAKVKRATGGKPKSEREAG